MREQTSLLSNVVRELRIRCPRICTPCLPRHHAKVPGALVLLRAPALTAVARRLAARNDRKGG